MSMRTIRMIWGASILSLSFNVMTTATAWVGLTVATRSWIKSIRPCRMLVGRSWLDGRVPRYTLQVSCALLEATWFDWRVRFLILVFAVSLAREDN